MRRKKVSINKKTKKIFANSAKKTHAKNIKTTTARGGYRI